jgi:hypothetical protein
MKRIIIDEKVLRQSIRKHILEQAQPEVREEKKNHCVTTNTMPLDEITGKSDDFHHYTPSVKKRRNGVNSMVDTLGILNGLRLFKDINDGGAHLAYEMLNNLNAYRGKNYFDETSNECHKAMDKVIELYKENEHGTELVKDIEKVLALQTKEDEYTPSPRAKEYLKRCLVLLKEK